LNLINDGEGKNRLPSQILFLAFYLEGIMKRIMITSIAALLAIWLAACSSSWTGSGKGGKDSSGGSNATPSDNRPSTGAQDIKQRVTNTQGAKQTSNVNSSVARGDKQRVKYAKQRNKGAERSMAKSQRRVKQQGEYVELQIIETQDVDQMVIDVMPPAEEIKAQSVEVIEQPVAPTVVVDTYEEIIRPQARRIYWASPVYPACSTAYEDQVEVRVQ
jgi:TolA-binding protein